MIVKSTVLSVEIAVKQLDQAIALVEQARTFEDVHRIRDTVQMTEAFLRTKQAATLLGERAFDVKQKAERLRVEADRKLGELSAALPAKDKEKALSSAGVSRREASRAELAARVPRKQFEAYVKVRHATNMEARTSDLAILGRLDNRQRIDAILALRSEPSIRAACGDQPEIPRSQGPVLDTLIKVREAWLTSANVKVFSDWLNGWIDDLSRARSASESKGSR